MTTTPQLRWIRLCDPKTGTEAFAAGFDGPCSAWGWIVETVAHEHGCHEDDVHCEEDMEGGGDLVTVDGVALYRIRHGLPN